MNFTSSNPVFFNPLNNTTEIEFTDRINAYEEAEIFTELGFETKLVDCGNSMLLVVSE